MRRIDREVADLQELCRMLDACDVLHVGLCQHNVPYVVPLSFGWESVDGRLVLWFHCARQGRKTAMLKANPAVSVCASRFVRYDQTAAGVTARYESVMGEGTASEDSKTEGSTAEDSTENAQGDMPAMPEGMQEGHRGPGGHGGRGNGQTPPDMSQDGATEMQTPPDMNQDGTTEDQISSEMSHDGHTGGPMMGEQGQQEMSQEAEDQAEEQTVTAQTVDAGSWKIYGGCAALLIAAIAVSMMYKRH